MRAALYGLFLFACAGLVIFACWDILFSRPTTHKGVITELIFVPGKAIATYTPLQGRKIGNQPVVAAKEEQYIAIVKRDDSELVQVHCIKEHYDKLAVGEELQYKKYEGEVFHIKYFAHYEDH